MSSVVNLAEASDPGRVDQHPESSPDTESFEVLAQFFFSLVLVARHPAGLWRDVAHSATEGYRRDPAMEEGKGKNRVEVREMAEQS